MRASLAQHQDPVSPFYADHKTGKKELSLKATVTLQVFVVMTEAIHMYSGDKTVQILTLTNHYLNAVSKKKKKRI